MTRFMTGDKEQMELLKTQIQGRLSTYENVKLPPNCTPSTTRMGFEYTPQHGYTLYIDKGIKYIGYNREFQAFLSQGEKRFESYNDMMNFIKGLKPLYENNYTARTDNKTLKNQLPPGREIGEIYNRSKIKVNAAETAYMYIDSNEIYNELTKKIKGQNNCMKELADITSIHLAQSEPERPATVFMMGPTGTGKTESANALFGAINAICAKQNGQKYQIIRINCNQYKEAHRVAQLLGSPNGYVGYGDPPVIAPLANNPRAIVLFDEIEKAHSDVLDVIMNAMDTGIIQIPCTINGKNEIDCKPSIFIFTSNLPVSGKNQVMGFSGSVIKDDDIDEMCKRALVDHGIKPEIAGRILAFLVYKPLEAIAIADIIAIAIVDCAKSFGVGVKQIDEQIIQCILDKNSTSFGARTYKQNIQKKIGKVFAKESQKYRGMEVSIKGELDNVIIEA